MTQPFIKFIFILVLPKPLYSLFTIVIIFYRCVFTHCPCLTLQDDYLVIATFKYDKQKYKNVAGLFNSFNTPLYFTFLFF